MVKFLEYEVRNDVWSKGRSLGSMDGKIWIKEDYPPLIEKRLNLLTPYLRAAYQGDPKNPRGKISAYMNLDQLVINNQKYTYDTVHLIPDYIQSRINSENKPSVKYSETVTIFFTKRSPLSNFHDAEFTVNDESYVNVDQYLSQQKESPRHFAVTWTQGSHCRDIILLYHGVD